MTGIGRAPSPVPHEWREIIGVGSVASADRSPKGQDTVEWLDAKHESAVTPKAADAQKVYHE